MRSMQHNLVHIETLVNGSPLTAIVDSGSEITIISLSLTRKLKLRVQPQSSIIIDQVSGTTNSVGRVTFNLTINHITHQIQAHVIKGFQHNLLIGLDMGSIFNLTVNFNSRTATSLHIKQATKSPKVENPLKSNQSPIYQKTVKVKQTSTHSPQEERESPKGKTRVNSPQSSHYQHSVSSDGKPSHSPQTRSHHQSHQQQAASSKGKPNDSEKVKSTHQSPYHKSVSPERVPIKRASLTQESSLKRDSCHSPNDSSLKRESSQPTTTEHQLHSKTFPNFGLERRRAPFLEIPTRVKEIVEDSQKMSQSPINSHKSPNQSSEEVQTYKESIINQFTQLFAQSDDDVGHIRGHEIHIKTTTDAPIYTKLRRRSPQINDLIRGIVKDLLARNLIRRSNSPYGFQVTLAYRKNGKPRLCVDYRPLNAVTVDDKFGLPNIQDIIDRLQGAKFFTKLDIAWGYHHIPMAQSSIAKTAFITDDGQYEWLVCPFGLKCAPSAFQRIISSILGELSYSCAINYSDDVIIYSKSLTDHKLHVQEVLTKFAKNNIKLRREKCTFFTNQVTHLGYIIKDSKVTIEPTKLQAVKEFPEPTTKKEIQRFLGLTSFCRKLIPNFTEKAYPLILLTRKDTNFEFTETHRQSFTSLKSALISAPILTIYNPDLPCELYTDASRVGIGSILMQRKSATSQPSVIAYFSKRLTPEQEKWSTCDLEGLAVIESIENFDCYLRSLPFKVFTDNSALSWIANSAKLKGRLHRWFLRLQTYTFSIHYRKGVTQQHADALSRAPVNPPSEAKDMDPQTGKITDMRIQETQAPSPSNYFKVFHITEQEPIDMDLIRKFQTSVKEISKPIIKNGIITVKIRGKELTVIPPELINTILKFYHHNFNHQNSRKTLKAITHRYFWPTVKEDTKNYIKFCDTCQRIKASPIHGEMQLMPCPNEPFEFMSIDTMVMGNAAKGSKNYCQVIIDHCTRYTWTLATKFNTTSAAISALQQVITTFQAPKILLMDNGKNFISKEFKNFVRSHGTIIKYTSTYTPQTNGTCERVNQTLKKGLQMAQLENPKLLWSTFLPQVTDNYNSTVHDVTGFTPKFLLLGITTDPTLKNFSLSQAREESARRTRSRQELNKKSFDKHHTFIAFKPGDKVLWKVPDTHPDKHKLSPKYIGPYTIIKQVGPLTYQIESDETGKLTQSHIHLLKAYHQKQPQETLQNGRLTDPDPSTEPHNF